MKRAARIFAGVDEAGLGPLLGPLCLGCAIFSIPDGDFGLRGAFRGLCVGADVKLTKNDRRIRVCDSKLLHKGSNKFAALERTALAFLSAAHGGKFNFTIRDVLCSGMTPSGAFDGHPWYGDLNIPLPLEANAKDVRRAARRIMKVCETRNIKILEFGARVVPERELNALFDKTNNKSVALFESVAPLLGRVGSHAAGKPILVCDRHGARASYAPLLSNAFDGAWIQIVREARRESLYLIKTPRGRVRVAFAEKGEGRSFACALASCLAKYARELAMERWNSYFNKIAPGVRPTAGYYTDAKRYLKQAGPALRGAGVDLEMLVRNR